MEYGSTPSEIENQRKRLLIYAFVLLGGSFLFIFGCISLLKGRYLLGSNLVVFLVLSLLAAYITKRSENVQPVGILLSIILYFLSSYLLLSGGAEGTGAYWSYPISMLMALLVGPKLGSLFVSAYVLTNTVFLYGGFSFVYDYSSIESIRIIITSICLFVLILASEWIRMGSYGAISDTSELHRLLASTDSLTNLLNRNGLKGQLEEKQLIKPAVLAILDVDKFKSINDSYGHNMGDEVLKTLARYLKEDTKGGDLSARWGGEEFLIILFDTQLSSAKTLIEKIKNKFSQHKFSVDDKDFFVTFSAGMAILDEQSAYEATVRKADSCLYQAKNSGRNLVVSEC